MHRPCSVLIIFFLILFPPASFAEVLMVGFGTHKPPYVYEGENKGLEYELVEAALADAGIEIHGYYAPLEGLHRMLANKEPHAMATTNETSGVIAYYRGSSSSITTWR
ncbi:MAG: polar amino acid transport system substrate-binding protein [Halopseudomonas sp.]|jgi:polar amino acid transport system substrate-binding protein